MGETCVKCGSMKNVRFRSGQYFCESCLDKILGVKPKAKPAKKKEQKPAQAKKGAKGPNGTTSGESPKPLMKEVEATEQEKPDAGKKDTLPYE